MSWRLRLHGSGTLVADSLAGMLIRHGARYAPSELAGRLEEEWLADLAAHPPFTRLWFALGCCWAALVIAHEHGVPRAPAAAFPAAIRAITLELQSRLPRHADAFLLVVCLHLGVLNLLGTYMVFPTRPHRPVMVTLEAGAAQPPGMPGATGPGGRAPDAGGPVSAE